MVDTDISAPISSFMRGAPSSSAVHSTDRRAVVQAARKANIARFFAKTIERLNEPRTCVRCHAKYTEARNIGQWNCTAHTGAFDDYRLRYTCCERIGFMSRGCRRADHAHDWDKPGAAGYACIRVPQCLAEYVVANDLMTRIEPSAVLAPSGMVAVQEIRHPDECGTEEDELFYQQDLARGHCVLRIDWYKKHGTVPE